MKILELFAGMQSFSNVARQERHQVYTSDILELDGIDYVIDIMNFDVKKVPFIPDVIWASVNCFTWSIVAGNRHFDGKKLIPKTPEAIQGFIILEKTFEIINYFLNLNPRLLYYVENPVGKMQKHLQAGTLFGDIPRLVTIDQCRYGRASKKPTHIFTNNFFWQERQRCRGKKYCNHTEQLKNIGSSIKKNQTRYFERAKLPYELCYEIIKYSELAN